MTDKGRQHGQDAIKRAFSSSDLVVLALTFGLFFVISAIYFFVSYFTSEEFTSTAHSAWDVAGGIMGALAGSVGVFVLTLLVGMFLVKMQRQTMLGNALQVEYSDFAWLRDWTNDVSADLAMPRVEIFVTQDPVINAYAFGYVRPYTIVLHSGSIRYLTKNELKSVVVHEMAHIKYGHTQAAVYLTPFLVVPVISIAGSWIAGFWQRRTELTSDRLALMYMNDAELVKKALIKVHVGPDVSDAMNETARQWLHYVAERPMNRFAQTFSTHPFLVRRLAHIDKWNKTIEADPPAVQSAQQLR
ncbi:M48 family metallopeptidase [Microbacteriaceae bacterium]|nr:M48 family metallopeptidase [Candidatus Saccharibacteria bacterium]